jgi:hypothetical protein
MATLLKVLLVALGVLGSYFDKKDDKSPEERKMELARTLDLLFSLALCGFLSVQLGAFATRPLQASGFEALGEVVVLLLLMLLKGVVFVLLPALLLTILLRSFEGLAVRLVVYGVCVLVGVGSWHFGQRQTKTAAVAAANAKQEAILAEAAEVRAGEIAIEEEIRGKADLRAKLAALSVRAHEKWRADIEAAGALGAPGEIPPMLAISEAGPGMKSVKNLSPLKVCVNIARVVHKEGSGIYERCAFDASRECTVIMPGRARDFRQYPSPSYACAAGLLEFRVGTPLDPEPSWWSRSGIEDYDRNPPDPQATYANLTELHVRGESAILEKIVAETGRAERWKRELGR